MDWLNQNQGVLAALGLIMAIFGGIWKWVFQKDKRITKSTTNISNSGEIHSGRDTNIGQNLNVNNYGNEQNNLETFTRLIVESEWEKKPLPGLNERWICKENNLYQIIVDNESDYHEFSEPWTRCFPDEYGSFRRNVILKINNVEVESFLFIGADGGRVFVPLPQREYEGDEVSYYWDSNSLYYKIAQVIGDDLQNGFLDDVARRCNIKID